MKISVFSGTSDGRELCEYLAYAGHEVTVYVATEYGATFIEGMKVHVGRLDIEQMAAAVCGCDAVIDATHPYAAEATDNIKAACDKTKTEYFRLIRSETEYSGCIRVPDMKAAVAYLRNTAGRIFVSTGSKELAEFKPLGGRVTARVLDTAPVHEKCGGMGINKIMYKMPPYSYKDNIEDFRDCKYLVTKDGGSAGGTAEKLDAANALGMTVVMIERPENGKDGYGLEELKKIFTV